MVRSHTRMSCPKDFSSARSCLGDSSSSCITPRLSEVVSDEQAEGAPCCRGKTAVQAACARSLAHAAWNCKLTMQLLLGLAALLTAAVWLLPHQKC